jgi:hypothetical protein
VLEKFLLVRGAGLGQPLVVRGQEDLAVAVEAVDQVSEGVGGRGSHCASEYDGADVKSSLLRNVARGLAKGLGKEPADEPANESAIERSNEFAIELGRAFHQRGVIAGEL